jgi:peptide/nickel transport system ATP-binding protein
LQASIHTAYGLVKAVDRVSLEIQAGQIFGLIGETGSGKSVLGLAVMGLLQGNAKVTGKITYKGEDILQWDRNRLRKLRGREIALIPQNPAASLNPVIKVGAQITEVFKLQRYWGLKRAKAAAIQQLTEMNMAEPEQKMQSYPFQLSGGMKQRVVTAIGTAGSPSLIIADEPTKGLDALVRV